MRPMRFLPLICALVVSTAFAQQGQEPDTDAYQGRWLVRMQGSSPKSPPVARLVVKGYGGTWYDLARNSKSSPCNGKQSPVTVQASTRLGFEFSVWGSSLTPACPDISVTVKSVTADTLDGATADGKPIRMTRK